MRTEELGQILREMYDTAPPNCMVTMIHLFGIQYADQLQGEKFISRVREVAKAANLEKYIPEIYKGKRLAEYVTRKGAKEKPLSKEELLRQAIRFFEEEAAVAIEADSLAHLVLIALQVYKKEKDSIISFS